MKKKLAFALLFVVNQTVFADELLELTQIMRQKDQLLFEMIYGRCDLQQLDQIIAEDFEFYHDVGGITPNKAAFMKLTREGSCQENPKSSDYKSYRIIIDGTFQIFPMKQNEKIYAILVTGNHAFYESYRGSNLVQTSVAKFSNLWSLENAEWKLSRVLSYDHQINQN